MVGKEQWGEGKMVMKEEWEGKGGGENWREGGER